MTVETNAPSMVLTLRIVLGEVDVISHDEGATRQSLRPFQAIERLVKLQCGAETLGHGVLVVHRGLLAVRVAQIEGFLPGISANAVSRVPEAEGV
jgi:hypothetical protein